MRRGRGPGGPGFIGCFVVALVLFIATITALATWVAGALLGVIAPGAAPSAATAVAVVVVLVIAVALAIRVFASTIRPLADLGEAAERLADGEPDVRVTPRGPAPGPRPRARRSTRWRSGSTDRARIGRRCSPT